jgi:hypothetical protein
MNLSTRSLGMDGKDNRDEIAAKEGHGGGGHRRGGRRRGRDPFL